MLHIATVDAFNLYETSNRHIFKEQQVHKSYINLKPRYQGSIGAFPSTDVHIEQKGE